jgi:hypothetical protein
LEDELWKYGISVGDGFSISPKRLQTPLNVALGISPLLLLGSHLLANVSIGKLQIIEVLNATCTLEAH